MLASDPKQTPLQILHRINLNVAGGVENQLRSFIEHPLVREQISNEVLVGEPVHQDLEQSISWNAHSIHSFKRWHGLKLPRWPAFIRDRNISHIIRTAKPDAVLSWSAFAKPALAKACARYDVPLVYREGGAAWGNADRSKARRFLDQVSGAICNTNASQRMLELKWGFQGPSRVCLSGTRDNALSSEPQPRDIHQPLVLGCAARLVPIKGVCLAIHALDRILRAGVQAQLRIAGDGPERNRLNELVNSLGLQRYVQFLGSLNDMQAFYEDVDIFMHAALREPLGNVCLEAAANGCIVVASRVDGITESIEDDVTGVSLPANLDLAAYDALGGHPNNMPDVVYDPDEDVLRELRCVDPDTLAAAVLRLVEEPERAHRLSATGIERIRSRFSFDRYVNEVVQAIRDFTGIKAQP